MFNELTQRGTYNVPLGVVEKSMKSILIGALKLPILNIALLFSSSMISLPMEVKIDSSKVGNSPRGKIVALYLHLENDFYRKRKPYLGSVEYHSSNHHFHSAISGYNSFVS